MLEFLERHPETTQGRSLFVALMVLASTAACENKGAPQTDPTALPRRGAATPTDQALATRTEPQKHQQRIAEGRARPTQDVRCVNEPSAHVVAVLVSADSALAARLRGVAADEAERYTMTKGGRIVGYPIDGTTHAVPSNEKAELVALLINPDNYARGPRIRCRNRHFWGLRFVRGGDRVEFMLGMRCRQLLWAEGNDDGTVKRFGSGFISASAKRIEEIISNSVGH